MAARDCRSGEPRFHWANVGGRDWDRWRAPGWDAGRGSDPVGSLRFAPLCGAGETVCCEPLGYSFAGIDRIFPPRCASLAKSRRANRYQYTSCGPRVCKDLSRYSDRSGSPVPPAASPEQAQHPPIRRLLALTAALRPDLGLCSRCFPSRGEAATKGASRPENRV